MLLTERERFFEEEMLSHGFLAGRSFLPPVLAVSPFGTVVPMILGEIKRYLRDNNAIRVSRSVRDLAYRALQARDALAKEKNGEVSYEEIAAALRAQGEEHTPEEIVAALDAIATPVSLYDPLYGDGGNDTVYVMDQLRDEEEGEGKWLESIALKAALTTLTPRERSILAMRFFRGKTQMEIAEEIGISQAQVSRLEKGALQRIKKQM